MINISDISIRKISNDKFRIVTPGNTRIVTSLVGVNCILASCRKNSFEEMYNSLDFSIKQIYDYDSIMAFMRKLLDSGLIYITKNLHTSPFNISGIKKGLTFSKFRSISELNICPSYQCNLNCSYCRIQGKQTEIDLKILDKSIKQAVEFGLNIVNILGGEPCLFPNTVKRIIEISASHGIERITVSTNGILLSEEIAKMWANSGLKVIQISIDLYNGSGKSFENSRHGVKLACDCFDEVSVAYVYYGQNNDDNLMPIINELKDKPIRLDLKLEIPFENTKLPINAIDIEEFSNQWGKYSDVGPLITPLEDGLDKLVYCGAGNSHAFVYPNGDIRPCAFLNESIGNINNEEFFSIWLNDRWSYYTKAKPIRIKKCIVCNYQKSCIGGCLARFNSREKNCIFNNQTSDKIKSSTCISSIPKYC